VEVWPRDLTKRLKGLASGELPKKHEEYEQAEIGSFPANRGSRILAAKEYTLQIYLPHISKSTHVNVFHSRRSPPQEFSYDWSSVKVVK
jgi:hypothetical protein